MLLEAAQHCSGVRLRLRCAPQLRQPQLGLDLWGGGAGGRGARRVVSCGGTDCNDKIGRWGERHSSHPVDQWPLLYSSRAPRLRAPHTHAPPTLPSRAPPTWYAFAQAWKRRSSCAAGRPAPALPPSPPSPLTPPLLASPLPLGSIEPLAAPSTPFGAAALLADSAAAVAEPAATAAAAAAERTSPASQLCSAGLAIARSPPRRSAVQLALPAVLR